MPRVGLAGMLIEPLLEYGLEKRREARLADKVAAVVTDDERRRWPTVPASDG